MKKVKVEVPNNEELESIKKHNQEVVDRSKLTEKLDIQKTYLSLKIECAELVAQLDVLQEQLLKPEGEKLDIKWMGMPCPKNIAQNSFNKLYHNYRMTLSNFLKHEAKLKELYTEEQINEIESYKFIKE